MSQGPLEAIIELVKARGIVRINEQPGVFHLPVDDNWNVFINPHQEPHPLPSGAKLMPLLFLVEFNGWPAGVFHPADETIVFADGEAANVFTFVAAVQAVIAREAA